MGSVLAAVDLTPLGRRVADRARIISEQLETDLTLLHAVEPMAEALIGLPVSEMIGRYRRKAAGELADWCRGRSSRPVGVKVVKGSPAWEIVRAGKGSELIVVGSSSLDAAQVGSVSQRVAETARGDVLVVRRQPRGAYRRVVVPTDLSEFSTMALPVAHRIAPDADLHLVFALNPRFDGYMAEAGLFPEEIDSARRGRMAAATEVIERLAGRWQGTVKAEVIDGPPLEVIEELVRRVRADLTVVASRGAGATKLVLLGSVASRLLEVVPVDVAIARVPGEFRRP